MSKPGTWLGEVKSAVDAHLTSYFELKRVSSAALAPEALELVEALEGLTIRGGKRFRPAVLVAAFRAVAPESRDWHATVPACSALELLQSYLLIHDDWMDGDDERRGGPAVHAALSKKHGDAHLGASLAILAGDLGSAFAWELFLQGASDSKRHSDALNAFVRMHVEVVFGQSLDLLATADVSRMQKLKTGSYTVEGPMRVGALLGDASAEQLMALEAFAEPLGEAFQIADDLLGTFGDPEKTGKPAGNDIRAGKRTSLVREAETMLDEAALAPLRAALGNAEASDTDIAAATKLLVDSGARKSVEARLETLYQSANAALEGAGLIEPGVTMLRELAEAIVRRDR